MAIQIAVVGSGTEDKNTNELARKVGGEIAKRGGVLVCGGLKGVMEAAAMGAKEAGGTTLGIIPGDDPKSANKYIDHVIVTGMGHARNVIVVKSADAVAALPGGPGTLSEIALALKMGKPVICVGGFAPWETIDGVKSIKSPAEAVKYIFEKLSKKLR
ncbi:MAG: TIGR00725 family protein [Deltaproteobacteria bacterium]|uniref:TIGR00725 family protein n=1 Tax=Candidatus Zymogenus saltonus TaxID=2844893 RepID=A0A9D8KHH6_9DELT|nr:TIGR00725 family protein [Candidatus Zymogenus saltonus]